MTSWDWHYAHTGQTHRSPFTRIPFRKVTTHLLWASRWTPPGFTLLSSFIMSNHNAAVISMAWCRALASFIHHSPLHTQSTVPQHPLCSLLQRTCWSQSCSAEVGGGTSLHVCFLCARLSVYCYETFAQDVCSVPPQVISVIYHTVAGFCNQSLYTAALAKQRTDRQVEAWGTRKHKDTTWSPPADCTCVFLPHPHTCRSGWGHSLQDACLSLCAANVPHCMWPATNTLVLTETFAVNTVYWRWLNYISAVLPQDDHRISHGLGWTCTMQNIRSVLCPMKCMNNCCWFMCVFSYEERVNAELRNS